MQDRTVNEAAGRLTGQSELDAPIQPIERIGEFGRGMAGTTKAAFAILMAALPALVFGCASPRAGVPLDAHAAGVSDAAGTELGLDARRDVAGSPDAADTATAIGSGGGGGNPGTGGASSVGGGAGTGEASVGSDAGVVVDTGQIAAPDATTGGDALASDEGRACATGADCSLGNCVDGVCCAQKCDGLCMACAQAITGRPDGVCAAAIAGQTAHKECVADAVNACGNDGTCDGVGKCRKYASTKVCAPSSCDTAGAFIGSSTCDGAGKCIAPAPVTCSPYSCAAATGCVQTCTADGQCLGQSYCTSSMMCAPKKVDGAACSSPTGGKECLHGFCVDGVCCNTACTGTCLSCSTAQAKGTCSPEASGTTDSGCAKDGSNVCGLDGACDGAGSCRKGAKGLACGAATCSGATFTSARSCDGGGTCLTGALSACSGALTCASATACRTSCTVTTDCTAGSYCGAGNKCVPRLAAGAKCGTSNDSCTSGHCVEGVCCNAACGTACHSCLNANTAQTEGVCNVVKVASSCGTNMVCSAAGVCGSCTANMNCEPANSCKKMAISCTSGVAVCGDTGNKTAGTTCGAAQTCKNGTKVGAYVCDGSGACPTPTSTSCPYGCNAAGTDCELGPCQKSPVSADCCPKPFTDHWTVPLTASTKPWSVAVGAPETVDADDHLVLSYDDVIARQSLVDTSAAGPGFKVSFSLTFSPGADQVFVFDFGDANPDQRYPAIRQSAATGMLVVGGMRYGHQDWGAFGNWSGTGGSGQQFASTTVDVTLYVKAKALAARVSSAGQATDTGGFVSVPGLSPATFLLGNANEYAGTQQGLITMTAPSGCAGFSDDMVQSLYNINK